MAKVLGPSASIPGAFDVQTPDGETFAVTEDQARMIDPGGVAGGLQERLREIERRNALLESELRDARQSGEQRRQQDADQSRREGESRSPGQGGNPLAPLPPILTGSDLPPLSSLELEPAQAGGAGASAQFAQSRPSAADAAAQAPFRPLPGVTPDQAARFGQRPVPGAQASDLSIPPMGGPTVTSQIGPLLTGRGQSLQEGQRLGDSGGGPPQQGVFAQSSGTPGQALSPEQEALPGGAGEIAAAMAVFDAANAQRQRGAGGPRVTATETFRQEIPQPTASQAAGIEAAGQSLEEQRTNQQIDAVIAAEGKAERLEQAARARAAGQEQMRNFEVQQATRREAALAGLRRFTDETNRINQEVASRRVEPFLSRSTGARIGGAISIGLGAIGQGLQQAGGNREAQNTALGIINDAIDRDIAVQQANIENAQRGVRQREGIYQEMLASLGAEDQAVAATRAAMLTDVQNQVQAIATQAEAEGVRNEAGQLFQQLGVAQQQASLAGQQAAVGRLTIEREQRQRSGGGGGGGPRVTFEQALQSVRRSVDAVRETREVDPARLAQLSERMAIHAGTENALDNLRALIPSTGDIEGIGPIEGELPEQVPILSALLGGPGILAAGQPVLSEEGFEIRRHVQQLRLFFQRAISGAQMTEQEAVRIRQALGLLETGNERDFRRALQVAAEVSRRIRATTLAGATAPTRAALQQGIEDVGGLATPRTDISEFLIPEQ